MTFKKLFTLGLILAVILAAIKVVFIGLLNMQNSAIFYGFYILIFLVSLSVARRMGLIMYIEAGFLAFVWTIMSLLVDGLITVIFIGSNIFHQFYFWAGYIVMAFAIFCFHKKRHLKIRREILSGGGHH